MTIDRVRTALREVPSYAYEGDGYQDRYETVQEAWPREIGPGDEPTDMVREPLLFNGAYVAPDQGTVERELVYDSDIWEAWRRIGERAWVRFVGSLRWQLSDSPSARPAHELLPMVDDDADRIWTDYTLVETDGCRLVLRATLAAQDLTAERTTTLTVDPLTALPVTVELTTTIDRSFDRWGREFNIVESYRPDYAADVAIVAPEIGTAPFTWDEALYFLGKRGCLTPPCDTSDVRMVYEVHQPPVDLFGYDRSNEHEYVAFEQGGATTRGVGACETPQFDVYDLGGGDEGGQRWIGGPLGLPDAAKLRITYWDGVEEVHDVSPPAYIVPAREVSPDGSGWIEDISVRAADGTELLLHDLEPDTEPPPHC